MMPQVRANDGVGKYNFVTMMSWGTFNFVAVMVVLGGAYNICNRHQTFSLGAFIPVHIFLLPKDITCYLSIYISFGGA